MKHYSNLSVLALSTLLSVSARAGNASAVTLTTPNFMPNGVVIVYVMGQRTLAPTCATQAMRFSVNANTAQGKTQLTGLLLAYSMGKSVTIFGTGTCTDWGDTESIDFFQVND